MFREGVHAELHSGPPLSLGSCCVPQPGSLVPALGVCPQAAANPCSRGDGHGASPHCRSWLAVSMRQAVQLPSASCLKGSSSVMQECCLSLPMCPPRFQGLLRIAAIQNFQKCPQIADRSLEITSPVNKRNPEHRCTSYCS